MNSKIPIFGKRQPSVKRTVQTWNSHDNVKCAKDAELKNKESENNKKKDSKILKYVLSNGQMAQFQLINTVVESIEKKWKMSQI